MSELIKKFKNLPNFFSLKGGSAEEITNAENTLNLKFSKEYCDYLSEFGVVSANGHEYTGICCSPRLSVVDVTLYEREHNPNIPYDWYVIEQANIDGVVIWQNEIGEIFQTQSCCDCVKIADSLEDYIINISAI